MTLYPTHPVKEKDEPLAKMKPLAWLMVLLPVYSHADEKLIGIWENAYLGSTYMDATLRFTFKPDNQFELYQNIALRNEVPDIDLPADDGEFEAPQIDPGFVVQGSGTWWTVADSLFFDLAEADETLNREYLEALLTEAGKREARFIAEMTGYWPEPWAAYEEAVVAELIGRVERVFYFEGYSGPIGTYRIEHGKLWIIETWEDGTVAMTDFSRMNPATAVTSSTWGAVKKGFK